MQLRPATPADQAFLKAVYASTRADELALLSDWGEAAVQAFVEMQFQAQTSFYRQQYPQAEHCIIVSEGEAVGRLWLARLATELRLLDLGLLPAWQGQGLGRQCLRQLQAQATQLGRALSLHVEINNRARRLYQALGFEVQGQQGLHLHMLWRPIATAHPEVCERQAHHEQA